MISSDRALSFSPPPPPSVDPAWSLIDPPLIETVEPQIDYVIRIFPIRKRLGYVVQRQTRLPHVAELLHVPSAPKPVEWRLLTSDNQLVVVWQALDSSSFVTLDPVDNLSHLEHP